MQKPWSAPSMHRSNVTNQTKPTICCSKHTRSYCFSREVSRDRDRDKKRDQEDEEEAYERRKLERKLRDKEAAYQEVRLCKNTFHQQMESVHPPTQIWEQCYIYIQK